MLSATLKAKWNVQLSHLESHLSSSKKKKRLYAEKHKYKLKTTPRSFVSSFSPTMWPSCWCFPKVRKFLSRGGCSPHPVTTPLYPSQGGAAVTEACGFINKYLSVCCCNEERSNLKLSRETPGVPASGASCWCQSRGWGSSAGHLPCTCLHHCSYTVHAYIDVGRWGVRRESGGQRRNKGITWGSSTLLWPEKVLT